MNDFWIIIFTSSTLATIFSTIIGSVISPLIKWKFIDKKRLKLERIQELKRIVSSKEVTDDDLHKNGVSAEISKIASHYKINTDRHTVKAQATLVVQDSKLGPIVYSPLKNELMKILSNIELKI